MQVIAIEFTEHPKYGKKPSLPVEKKMESWRVFILLRSTVLQCLSLGTVSIPSGRFFIWNYTVAIIHSIIVTMILKVFYKVLLQSKVGVRCDCSILRHIHTSNYLCVPRAR